MGTNETTFFALIAIGLCVVIWHINDQLRSANQKLNLVLEQFDGLRNYLYEIDPQFDDERQAYDELMGEAGNLFAGADCLRIERDKEASGRRTLNTTFAP